MFTKLATIAHSKVALAVLGLAVVTGGGAAVAVAAHSGSHAQNANAAHAASHTPEASANSHAHTVAINGTLKAYDAAAHTISVLADGATTPTTISVNADTKVNGNHASTLADLANAIGREVQVQAQKQSDSSLIAWKITVTGDTQQDSNGNSDGNRSDNAQDHQH